MRVGSQVRLQKGCFCLKCTDRERKGWEEELSEKGVAAERKVNGDNRPTVGGTRVSEGGETQARGGSIELGIKLMQDQRQSEKEGGTKEP